MHLSESEAIGVLLGLTIAEKVSSPILLGDVRSLTRKIATSFAPAQAGRVRAVRSRILIGSNASSRTLADYTPPADGVTKPLLDAFTSRHVARIAYQDQHGTLTEREIEPHYLFYSVPIWYALAWDRLRSDIRTFRLDRIRHVHVGPDQFRLRPEADFLHAGEPSARPL